MGIYLHSAKCLDSEVFRSKERSTFRLDYKRGYSQQTSVSWDIRHSSSPEIWHSLKGTTTRNKTQNNPKRNDNTTYKLVLFQDSSNDIITLRSDQEQYKQKWEEDIKRGLVSQMDPICFNPQSAFNTAARGFYTHGNIIVKINSRYSKRKEFWKLAIPSYLPPY
jgi:hypothetical protein